MEPIFCCEPLDEIIDLSGIWLSGKLSLLSRTHLVVSDSGLALIVSHFVCLCFLWLCFFLGMDVLVGLMLSVVVGSKLSIFVLKT